VDELMEMLDDDDLVELIEGKKVKGVKLDKNLRREIKHMIKRNEVIIFTIFLGYKHCRYIG
jgi:hypothetical protein